MVQREQKRERENVNKLVTRVQSATYRATLSASSRLLPSLAVSIRPPPVPVVGVISKLMLLQGPSSPRLIARFCLAASSALCQEAINLSAPCSTPACHGTPPPPSPPPSTLFSGLQRRTARRPWSREWLRMPSGHPSGRSASSAPGFPCPGPPLPSTRRTPAASGVARPVVSPRPPRRADAVGGQWPPRSGSRLVSAPARMTAADMFPACAGVR